MANPTQPTVLYFWCQNSPGSCVAPSTGLIAEGYDPGQKPAALNFNALMNNYAGWISYLNYKAGSGGGGAALEWEESANLSPEPKTENNVSVYKYSPGNIGQALIAVLPVPPGYVTGSPIKIFNRVYSGDITSGATILFQTLTTLVRTGIDKMNSTTNQHISTNVAIPLSAATQWVPQAVIYDVSDNLGNVNGVAVSPGDLLIIELLRGADTSTVDASCITFASLPTFS